MRSIKATDAFTMVEITVVIGIVGLLAVIGMRFMRQADEGRVVGTARQATQETNAQLLGLIERDLRFRLSDTSYTIDPNQRSLTIVRRQALDLNQLNQSDDSYQVQFATNCVVAPAPLANYQDLSTQLNNERFKNSANCLRAIKCGAGQLPQVTLTITGTGRIPPYPTKVFPSISSINQSFRTHSVGTAVCFAAGPDQIRVTLDSIYAFSKDQFAPLSQDKSISIKSADFQLLPQEFKN